MGSIIFMRGSPMATRKKKSSVLSKRKKLKSIATVLSMAGKKKKTTKPKRGMRTKTNKRKK
jgi:hypothetical protein